MVDFDKMIRELKEKREKQKTCTHPNNKQCDTCDGYRCPDCGFHFYSDPVG